MESNTKSTFYVLQKGAVQEEPWEWEDIEAMCESGSFSRETMIFFPEDNEWRKAGDTDLVSLFPDTAETEDGEPGDEVLERYGEALAHISDAPGDWSAQHTAALIAVEMDDQEKAVMHFQEALELQPFQARVVQDAKRHLPPHVWRSLRKIERVEMAWEDLGHLGGYAFSHGALFVGAPALALAVLSFIPFLNLLTGPITFLFLTQTIFATVQREKMPPLWNRMLCDPATLIVRPLVVNLVVSAQISVPFAIIAGIMFIAGAANGPEGLVAVIAASPVLIVIAAVVGLFYLPATAMMVGSGQNQWRALNPAAVIRTIATTGTDYLTAVGLSFAMVVVWGALGFLFDMVPVLGSLWTAAFTIYFVLTAGYMFGTVYRRHEDQLS